MITAEIIGSGSLNNAKIERQQTVEVRIRVQHGGLTGAALRFVAKSADALSDDDDARALLNKTSSVGGGITIDTASTNTVLIARMKLSGLETSVLPLTDLHWGIQVKNAQDEIVLPELKGKITIVSDIVKTL
jgi:hypothetical protein